jgi:hypothetical protein
VSEAPWGRAMARSRVRDGRYAWQLMAAMAFVATAAVAVVGTRARVPEPEPAGTVVAASGAACTAGGLHAEVGLAAMTRTASPWIVDYMLEFTNVSSRTCVLDGYPSVEAFNGARSVGSPAVLNTSVRPKEVTLTPGATAFTLLRYTTTDWFDAAVCRQVTVPELRISPPVLRYAPPSPYTVGAMLVRWRNPACSRPGLSFLSVQAIQGGYRSPRP